jgi:hypothetical protein
LDAADTIGHTCYHKFFLPVKLHKTKSLLQCRRGSLLAGYFDATHAVGKKASNKAKRTSSHVE